jgi:membrane associated rhomboid family serine protease
MWFKLKIKGLFEGFSLRDLILLLIFPTIITLLMLLPDSIRVTMMLNVKDPQWWQFMTSGFMHQNWTHLTSNLIGYFLLVFPLFFLISTKTDKKRYYFRFLIFISLTFPVISSIFQVHFYPGVFQNLIYLTGSSGIIAAFSGLIPSFWLLSIANKDKLRIKRRFALISLFYLILSFLIIYFPIHRKLYLTVVMGILFVTLLFSYRKGFLNILMKIGFEGQRDIISAFILLLTIILFIFTPVLFFPKVTLLNNNYSTTALLVFWTILASDMLILGSIIHWLELPIFQNS